MSEATDNRGYLKAATHRAHERAETRWTVSGRFRDASAYIDWLRVMERSHRRLGLNAAACAYPHALQVEQIRISALGSDLGGGQGAPVTVAKISQSWAWGVLYALNGSALGASILLKSGAVPNAWPSAYLRVMRDYATSGGLVAFMRSLQQQALDLPQAANGADAVFEMIRAAPKSTTVA